MKWTIDYSGRAGKFIEKQGIRETTRSLLKGKWDGYLRIRSGNIRIILKVYKKEKRIYADKVDFRGSVY